MATNVAFTKLDFNDIKASLKTYLKGQDRFKDYDFDGANFSVLLDILAYNTYQNNIYTNLAFSEMFLDSAQLRDSVISHAKELNYLPSSRASSQVKLDVTLTVTGNPSTVEIPRGTKFKAICGSETFMFVSDESVTIIPTSTGVYKYTGLTVYEGEVLTEMFVVNGNEPQPYIISNKNVDTNSIRVRVRDNTEATSNTEFVRATSLFGVQNNDNVFYLEPHADERYQVAFGRNVFGKEPVNGNVVEIEYRITSGEAANGTKRFSALSTISGYVPSVVLNSESLGGSEGGAERETIDSIKYYAPKSIQIQDRVVSESDYEILLKNNFSEIQSVSVYGGETVTPPQYGRVIIAVDVKNSDGVSENAKARYADFLKARSPLAIEPVVVSPEFMYVSVDTVVTYNKNRTAKTASDINTLVKAAIANYSSVNLADFGKSVRFSKLSSAIDGVDDSVISNDTNIRAVIEINPVLNMFNNLAFSFGNALIVDHPLALGEDITIHKPAIKSSSFYYAGTPAFLQDDGNGALQVLSNTVDGFVYLNKNIGTVNYTNGEVRIKSLNISGYDGSAIKIYAATKVKDIIGPKQRIVSIRPEDVTITVNGISE